MSVINNKFFRVRLHQESASTQSQRCDDARDTALNEINGSKELLQNGVAAHSGATPLFSMRAVLYKRHRSVNSALTLTLGVNGPLQFDIHLYTWYGEIWFIFGRPLDMARIWWDMKVTGFRITTKMLNFVWSRILSGKKPFSHYSRQVHIVHLGTAMCTLKLS